MRLRKKEPDFRDPRVKWCKVHENTRKPQKTPQEIFLAHARISKIHHSPLKFDGDHESASYFDHSSIVEELSVYFRCVSGKVEFTNILKVKTELCSPHSIYQFKHSLSKE